MQTYFNFDEPLRLSDRQAILLADEVAQISKYEAMDAVLLYPARPTAAPIWLRDAEISASRSRYPSVPLLGFWQTALFNGAVDTHLPLHVAYTSPDSGIYLECEDGKAVRSGRFASNYIQDATVPLENAAVIELATVARWRISPVHARTLDELTRQRQRKERLGLFQLLAASAGVIVGAVIVNMMLSAIAQSRANDIGRYSTSKTMDQGKLDLIAKTINNHRFPDSKSLVLVDRFSSLYYSSNEVDADLTKEDLVGDQVIVVAALPFRTIGFASKIAQRQDGMYDVVIPLNPKGGLNP